MHKTKRVSLLTSFCLLLSCVLPMNIKATESKSLIFLGDSFSEQEINSVKNEYKDELSSVKVTVGELTDKTNEISSYAVDINEVKNNQELVDFINNNLDDNIIYFVGNGSIADVENALNKKIEIVAPIYNSETDSPTENVARVDNSNRFSVFGYSKNNNMRGYGQRAIIDSSDKQDLILTTIRQFKDNALTPQPREDIIRLSGNGGKLYTNIQKDIYTYSTWILYDIPSNDPSKNYYATKVNIYFNKDGNQACVKMYGSTFYSAQSIGAAPTNIGATTSWSASIPAGISVSYTGTKVKVYLSKPDTLTNQWCFQDGTFFGAYFSSGDVFECITQWSTSKTYKGVTFFYDENGYDMYGGYSAPTRTAISF